MSTLLPSVRAASGQGNLQQRCLSGVSFIVSTSIVSRLENLPTCNPNCTMSMHLSLKNKWYAMLFSVYTPTLGAEPAEIDTFYLELCSCLQSIPADKVIILGDCNAEWAKMQIPGKEYLVDTAVVNAMTMGTCYRSFALSSNLSPKPSSSKRTDLKQTGCILGPNIGTSLTTSLCTLVSCKLWLHFKP